MLRLNYRLTILLLVALLLVACQPIQALPTKTQTAGQKTAVLVKGAPTHGTNGLALGPDGNLYIASVGGHEILVMIPATGAILKRLGADVGVTSPDDLTFAPDGSLYWTNLMTGEVGRLAPDGTVSSQYVAQGVNPITFAADGRLFVALDFFGDALYELNPALVEPPQLLAEKLGFLNGFDFGPDGALYGPIYTQGKVVRIDVNTKPVTMTTVADGFGIAVAAKFDGEGRLHVLDQARGEVVQIELSTGVKTVIATLPFGLDNLAFDAQDQLFVSNAYDGAISAVLANGTAHTVSPGGLVNTGGVAVMQQGNQEVLYVGNTFTLNAFAAGDGQPGSVAAAGAMSVAPDGENLLLSSWFAGTVQSWNPQTGAALATYSDFAVPTNAIRFGGDLVVAELGTGSVVRANGADPTQRTSLATHLGVPIGLAATADALWVSDFATGQVLQLVADNVVLSEPKVVATGLSAPEGLAMGAEGKLLVVETGAQRLSAVDLATGQITVVADGLLIGMASWPNMPPSANFNGVAVAPDGTIYVTGDVANVVYRISAD